MCLPPLRAPPNETAAADPVQVALHFYNALKVYPSPGDLIHIYNNIVPKV